MSGITQRALQQHLIRAVLAAQHSVAPELLDMVSGSTPQEIDASVERARTKTQEILSRVRQEAARPSDVDPAWTVNVREGTTADDALLADRVANMEMAEYARERGRLNPALERSLVDFLSGAS